MQTIKYLIIILLLIQSNTILAKLSSVVNKTSINNSEQLKLIIQSDNKNINQNIDITELNKDFNVVNTVSRQSITYINGVENVNISLELLLEPKRLGLLTIPAFSIGKEKTKPIKIKVTDITNTNLTDQPIFITSEVNKTNPRTQEQVIYTINFYSKFNIVNMNIPFSAVVDNAIIKQLGSEKSFRRVSYKGKKLWLKRFTYAIYPQQSGTITINKFITRATLSTNGKNQQITLFTKAINLNVLKPNVDYPANKHWLPANNVTLSTQFITKPEIFKVGEVIVREITMQVSGQTKEQLPEIPVENNNSFEQYPDVKVFDEKIGLTNIISEIKQKIIVIPSRAGKQILPEVNVTWFDTRDNKNKIAKLPAYQVNVLEASSSINKNSNINDIPIVQTIKQSTIKPTSTITKKVDNWSNNYYFISTIIFFILWVLTLLWCLLKNTKQKPKTKEKLVNNKKYLHSIKKYAKKNDAYKTKQALDLWLNKLNKNYITIDDFISSINDAEIKKALQNNILILNTKLHKNTTDTNWNGNEFWQIFSQAISIEDNKTKTKIPSLYPNPIQ